MPAVRRSSRRATRKTPRATTITVRRSKRRVSALQQARDVATAQVSARAVKAANRISANTDTLMRHGVYEMVSPYSALMNTLHTEHAQQRSSAVKEGMHRQIMTVQEYTADLARLAYRLCSSPGHSSQSVSEVTALLEKYSKTVKAAQGHFKKSFNILSWFRAKKWNEKQDPTLKLLHLHDADDLLKDAHVTIITKAAAEKAGESLQKRQLRLESCLDGNFDECNA